MPHLHGRVVPQDLYRDFQRIARAEGVHLHDEQGKGYLDDIGGSSTTIIIGRREGGGYGPSPSVSLATCVENQRGKAGVSSVATVALAAAALSGQGDSLVAARPPARKPQTPS